MTAPEWISTGQAANILGFSPDHFREKFEGIIPSRRYLGGHHRWLAAAVLALVAPQKGAK